MQSSLATSQNVPTIDTNFRADPNRSICVFGELTDELVSKLAPEILDLRSLGEAPITVFINSNGGGIRCIEYLRDLLCSGTASGRRPRIITVAVGNYKTILLFYLHDMAVATAR